ncbi:hypothetical protein [Micromonospora cathayae]|uniref:Uncharacterized protein n=1 Tax=Micromonospora cathayae TaxID=3028804 RepID=A0ABY7ZT04_9ACTN|nr:hypothetical protein [Micromonospora sp. HUAS 3]WDZ85623.1 hypothetical protein PVK37_04000 [Micromonospora sp. HUAS 3]
MFTTQLLTSLVRSAASDDAVRQVLGDVLPWTVHLPEPDLDGLVAELVTVTRDGTAPEDPSAAAVLLAQWRHTAEVFADPVLLEILTRKPAGDGGPVPVPDGLGGQLPFTRLDGLFAAGPLHLLGADVPPPDEAVHD